MSRNYKRGMSIVHEGWLTKSPPTKRVWRAKWRRRWFTLRHSADGPAHYFLDYYTDRNTRKLKGTIDLDACEQVDAGLHMPRSNNDLKELKGSTFSIRTQSRIYHLEADSVAEMEKWVEVICRACGLKCTDVINSQRVDGSNTRSNQSPTSPNFSGNYIAISECITGPPSNDPQSFQEMQSFISKTQNELARGLIVHDGTPNRSMSLGNGSGSSLRMFIRDTAYIKNMAHSPSSTLGAVSKRFTRLSICDNSVNPYSPIPPRPPKPSRYSLDALNKNFKGPHFCEPFDVQGVRQFFTLNSSMQNKNIYANSPFVESVSQENKNDNGQTHAYYNIILPPVVDRELKPGRSRARFNQHFVESAMSRPRMPSDLQYLDLDLDKPSSDTFVKSPSHSPTNYRKVDFLKTSALNKTRLDNEASRGRQENSHRE